ncbi:glycosyltransferase family 9 protein [Paraburkholderia sp. J10-1]|uniref:glycosyltransferase family 9 protein n=1 Tax=Paraburkholderia sp. J10-1 TaxID=2805430 RepID=UPI002AB7F03E|nr:glycosyltransferase family 9 protein [Paraburkholderia sp. J10-1]
MKASAKRDLKRMIRRAAPGIADRLSVALRAARGAAVRNAARFGNLIAHIHDSQREFDERVRIDIADVAALAARSSIVVVGTAPFDNVAVVIDELRKEKLDVAEIVVVDATAEQPRFVAIRDSVESWRRRLPLTRFKVVPYSPQDIRYADALSLGWHEAQHENVWIVGRYDVPLDGCFTYLLKTQIEQKGSAVVVSGAVAPDASLRSTTVDPRPVCEQEAAILEAEESAALLARAIAERKLKPAKLPSSQPAVVFSEGIFGGARALLADDAGQLFDTRLLSNLAVTALAQRLAAKGVPVVRSGYAYSRSMLEKLTDGGPPWEAIYDLRRIAAKPASAGQDENEVIEIVCPFHRGDMILAVQVAASVAASGKRVRLHVAEQLVSWAREFGTGIHVESVPVPVAAAEDTYRVLLEAFQYVALRHDAAPRIARCHPSRSLSDTGRNLVEYMLEEAGLPLETRLPNLQPVSTDAQQRRAHEIVVGIGEDTVFVHPLGGWSLKSIPPHTMAGLAEEVHRAGLKLIQIGAASDRRVAHTDGAILENFMPSQWKEILALGRALICVDSWTSHFAAILDIPQICVYGSTHPDHVSSKRWFRGQLSPCLNLGPIVNCSPCNSLTCVAYPERDYCTGYTVDRLALQEFFAMLPAVSPS